MTQKWRAVKHLLEPKEDTSNQDTRRSQMLAPAKPADTRPAAPETPLLKNEHNISEEPFPWEEHRGDNADLDRTEGIAMEDELFGSPLDDTT